MRDTGIIRKVDELGRVVLPKEIRRKLDVEDNKDSFEIYVEDDKIILKKHMPACIFCGNTDNLVTYMDKRICGKCIDKFKIDY